MKPILNSSIADEDSTSSIDAVYVDIYGKQSVGDIVVVEGVDNKNIIKRLMASEGDLITIAKFENSYYFYRIPKDSFEEGVSTISDEEARVVESQIKTGYTIDYGKWNTCVSYTTDGYEYELSFYNTFLYEKDTNYNFYTSADGLMYVEVPENMVFCMGDNRKFSRDSRTHGFFDTKKIVGRVEIIVKEYSFVNRALEVVKYYYSQVEDFFAR